MGEISELTGRKYRPFIYYGDKQAENIIIAMGSVTETIKETIDHLNSAGGKYGLVSVHLYRPFSTEYLFKAIPRRLKNRSADRTKSPLARRTLYLDIKAAYQGKENAPLIVGGRYGLSSKDTTPAQIIAVYEFRLKSPKSDFTIELWTM